MTNPLIIELLNHRSFISAPSHFFFLLCKLDSSRGVLKILDISGESELVLFFESNARLGSIRL